MIVPAEPATMALTTLPTPAQAVALVRGLLARSLIACGTLLPGGRSLYVWDGAIADEAETVVLLKTHRDRLPAIAEAFAELHPYDVPELIALPITAGSAPYLRWLDRAITIDPTGSGS